jgi:hypothetical protein
MKKPKYKKVKVGNRYFKLKVADFSDDKKDWDLYKTNKKKYFDKFDS